MEFAKQICTDRLCLRPLKKSDLWFFFLLMGNKRVRRYLGGVVRWRLRLSNFNRYLSAPDYVGVWVVCLQQRQQAIGLVELGPHKDGKDYEVSYQFNPDFWGKGFAGEAVQTIICHALKDHGLERVIAETQAANAASCRLLKAQGMIEIDRVQRFGAQQIIFATN